MHAKLHACVLYCYQRSRYLSISSYMYNSVHARFCGVFFSGFFFFFFFFFFFCHDFVILSSAANALGTHSSSSV